MKNIFKIVLVALVALFLGACSDNEKPKEQEKTVIKVGATPIPHAEILQEVKKS